MATQQQIDETNKLLAQGNILGQQASQQTGIAYNPSAPITSADLEPVTQTNFSPLPQPDATNLNTSVTNPQAIIDEAYNPTNAETQQDTLANELAALIGGQQSQTGLTNEAEQAAGVPSLNASYNEIVSQLEGLNNQALALQNEAQYTIPNAAQVSAEGRGITAGGLAPITASQLRMNQIKQGAIATQSLTVKSLAYAALGKLSLAKDAAEKAATAKFEQQQIAIDAKRANLAALEPKLNREEKKRSALLTIKLNAEQQKVDNAREDMKTGQAMAGAAIKNNPNNPAALYAAQQVASLDSTDPQYLQKVFGLVGQYQSDPIAVENDLLDIAAKRETAALAPLRRRKLQAEVEKAENDAEGGGDELFGLVSTVLENPELFNQLTPSEKAKIAPALNKLGFTAFGKPLSDTAIVAITQTETALEGVKELKDIIKANEKYLGPISGLARFNPYSPAKQVQADVDRIRQRVGKALEGGVLRKEDEEKYKKILATLADTPTTAIYKINQLISDLEREVGTFKKNQALSGRNVTTAPTSTKSGKPFNYQAAKDAGYTEAEIQAFINSN